MGEEGVSLYSGVHKRLAVSQGDGLSSVLHEQLSLDRDSDSLTTSPSSSSLDTYSSHKLSRPSVSPAAVRGWSPRWDPAEQFLGWTQAADPPSLRQMVRSSPGYPAPWRMGRWDEPWALLTTMEWVLPLHFILFYFDILFWVLIYFIYFIVFLYLLFLYLILYLLFFFFFLFFFFLFLFFLLLFTFI